MNHLIQHAINNLTVDDISFIKDIESCLKEKKKLLKEEKRLQVDLLKQKKKEDRLIKNLERDRKKAHVEELKAAKSKAQAQLKLEKAERDEAHSKSVIMAKTSELEMRRSSDDAFSQALQALLAEDDSPYPSQHDDGYFDCRSDYTSDSDDLDLD